MDGSCRAVALYKYFRKLPIVKYIPIFFVLQLLGFGISVLEGIDPNAENFVSAGILHTRNQQVGVLVRLEPNKQAQVSVIGWSSALFLPFALRTAKTL